MKKKGDFRRELREEYSNSWSFIKKSSFFIWFGVATFFILAFVGFFAKVPEELSLQILDYFRELVKMTEGYGSFKMISFLFFNNLKASFFGMILGVVFGIIPLFYLLGNGFILGFASRFAVAQEGLFSLWRLLPHGIFELPAIFLSLGLGLKIGSGLFEKKNKWKALKNYFIESLKVFALIILPLLVVAAVVEGLLISLL